MRLNPERLPNECIRERRFDLDGDGEPDPERRFQQNKTQAHKRRGIFLQLQEALRVAARATVLS